MKFVQLKSFEGLSRHRRLREDWNYVAALILSLESKDNLSTNSVDQINAWIKAFNETKHTVKSASKGLNNLQSSILRQVRIADNILLPNYYQNQWMVYMAVGLGLPLGLIFNLLFDRFALLGFALGLAAGYLFGRKKDQAQGLNSGHLDVRAALDQLKNK
jgi:hypothetical protein